MNEKVILTGVRPTGVLTIANYLGAVRPIIELQKQGFKPFVFIADLHAFTDNEPAKVNQYITGLLADYLALGLDPKQAVIYSQSQIKGQVTTLMSYLARLITVAELLRVPTLKEKIKSGTRVETANSLLFMYPVLMAADILIQKADVIPVGQDQIPHLEISRLLAKRFNERYGEVFPIPQPHILKTLRILSLKGDGKMSKSKPEGAILLTDTPKEVDNKIKRAQTASAGEITPSLESLITICRELSETETQKQNIEAIIKRHKNKENVMGEFKKIATEIINHFLQQYQKRRESIIKNTKLIKQVLSDGGVIAISHADQTLQEVEKLMNK